MCEGGGVEGGVIHKYKGVHKGGGVQCVRVEGCSV